ncbi:MAG: DnaA/Hda family protein, partial [Deltaproteobacteria bacterium]|nr:DnaA/Hda family protein [Deltaproteobacteria bacterium]
PRSAACGPPPNGRAPHPTPAAPRRPARAPALAARAAVPLRFGFDSFVAGRENELALAAVQCVAHGRQPEANPIYVAAPAGMGKSHLARALVESLRRDGAEGVGYSTAGDFTGQFTWAVRRGDTAGFQRRYRNLRLLVLEDVQRLPRGKNATQLELIQTIEHVRMVGGRVVLTGDRLPREIEHLDGSLASHMASGLVAEMEAPGRALRRDILRDKASRFGLSIPARFLDELAERARGSVRDLEGVVKQLLQSSLVNGGRQHMDRAMIDAALRKLAPRGGLAPADVIACICSAYALSSEELRGKSRTRRVLEARQLAMYLCHHHCGASYSRIGRALGRSHSAVKNGVAKIADRVGSDERLRLRLEELSRQLKSRRWPPPA